MTVTSMRPKRVVLLVICAGVVIAVAAEPAAAADPILPVAGGGSASDAIQQLKSAGYDVTVQFPEGRPNVALS